MKKFNINLKRVYDAQAKDDGYRILVDKIWPRGIKKSDLQADEWLKEIAPSTGLRKWFDHEPEKWPVFKKRYREELEDNKAAVKLAELLRLHTTVTLLYSARDKEHNQALVIKEFLETKR